MKIYFLAHSSEKNNNNIDFESFKIGKKFNEKLNKNIKKVIIILSTREDISFLSGYFAGDLQKENDKLIISIIEDNRLDIKDRGVVSLVDKKTAELFNFVDNVIDLKKDINENETAIIISASQDVYNLMRRDFRIRKLCYFGDEEIKNNRVLKSSERINVGEIKEIILEKPFEVGYEGKFETIAERMITLRNQQQKS